MKLITKEDNPTKQVEYFDITFSIPEEHNFIATDKNGVVYSYVRKPEPKTSVGKDYWTLNVNLYNTKKLGTVDLQGLDWKETLRTYDE